MAEETEQEAPKKQLSLAEQIKEGAKAAGAAPTRFEDLDGASKAAVVLLSVGPEVAADVLRQVTPIEVQRISSKMAIVRSLNRDILLSVLRDFKEATVSNAQVAFDTDSFMQNMLQKALGTEGASDLLGKLEAAIDMSGLDALKRLDPDVAYEILKNEHPQVLATILTFYEPPQASALLKLFPGEIRNEVVLRVALLEKVQPAALKELNETMMNMGAQDTKRSNVGGVIPTAEILNLLSGGMDMEAIAEIRKYDGALADAIVEKMFTFEDLIELEDKAIQTLMLEVTQDVLVVALKGASPKLREKIFKNMAKRAADTVR
ncbi:MAG: flagellar motor switch protein FliG, partial [Betaproteobacteria bacterium]|nr:flagellar motor switch protein FliG [Betaproteobacteria bacterium]NDC03103.1 flagellar motor switch protein FliG [Betaproteobacteria bacterium]NDC85802.1 flagellar motor switch protein FliG [Betaproteobacteria bacterium]